MPPERPLLTIAIPTYNRSEFLAQLLTALAPQLEREPRVELLISDNASPDNTQELIRSYRARGLSCRYIRNETNIGSDANFLQCFKEAAGKYVWLVGDDDIIPLGAIDRLVSFLLADDFDLIHLLPLEFRTAPLTTCRSGARGRHALKIESASLFCWMVGNMFTLTTCNIINKHRLREVSPVLDEELLKSNLIQLAWTFPLLLNFKSGLYVFDRLISVRASNRTGYSISRVFGRNLKRITEQMLGSGSQLCRVMHQDILRNCLPYLVNEVRQRRFGNFEPEDFHRELKPIYGKLGSYWLFVYPIAVGPLWFARVWFQLTRRFNSAMRELRLVASFPSSHNPRIRV